MYKMFLGKGRQNTMFMVGCRPFFYPLCRTTLRMETFALRMGWLANLCESLVEVGNNVVDVFHTDGEAHGGWSDVLLLQFLGAKL